MVNIENILLENHLAFLGSHRGVVRADGDTIYVESDRPEFRYAILGRKTNLETLPATVRAVQVFPWSQPTVEELEKAGFAPATGLSYMVLGEDLPKWRVRNDLDIEVANDSAQMDVFSEVQSRGFLESVDDYKNWHPWLSAANHRNLQNPKQSFYVGSLGSTVLGVVLSVIEGGTAGIYAVATLPDHRKSGVSTTIMKRAISDAQARGCKTITLQVKQDSYVEEFYQHLGFKRVFTTKMFKREQ
jgi:GNAT superfamily N-acetyltransferase